MKNKRGLSEVIVTLIIILLAIVATGIIWISIKTIMTEGTKGFGLGGFLINLKIEQIKIQEDTSNLSVTIKRNSGKGDLVGINFIVSGENFNEVIAKNTTLDEFEIQTFIITIEELQKFTDIYDVTKVSIAPVYLSNSGEEITGNIVDTQKISLEDIEDKNGDECIPESEAVTCGTRVCGNKTNNCNEEIICGEGCNQGYGCFDGVCIEGCIPLLNNGDVSSKIDLVLIPDAYMTDEETDEFILTAQEYLGLIGNDGLFNIEPFKSNKNKFNVYYIDKKIALGGCYIGGDCDFEQINTLKNLCPAADETVVIFNNDYYDSVYTHKSYAQTCNHFATVISNSSIAGFTFEANILAHEFGHSFGCLKDLYYTQKFFPINPSWPNIDIFGCPKWCSGTPLIQEPDNQACEALYNQIDCEAGDFFPKCDWSGPLNRCLPLSITGACSFYSDEPSCLNAYETINNFDCVWSGYCQPSGGSVFNVGVDCIEGYECHQGAEGLAGYGAESSRKTIMGYMVDLRYDIASYEHLIDLLENYS